MIALWYNGKYYDTWFNTLSDTDFMEVSMINLGLDPAQCEWVEYDVNPNGHNPRQINDDDKSFDWTIDELVPQAIVTDPVEILSVQKKHFGHKVFTMLTRILSKQNDILEINLMSGEEIPPIPTQYADTPVENKVVMNPMKKLTVSDSVMIQGQRSKLYKDEKELPPKFDNLKSLAKHLLSKPTKWNDEFKKKLSFYGDMK